jgi:hypothetical protein
MTQVYRIRGPFVQRWNYNFGRNRHAADDSSGAAMRKLFKEHPATAGETYFEHMGSAFTFAARLFGAALACFVHGLFPFLFTSTGSATVKRLYQGMILARSAPRGHHEPAGDSVVP